MDNRRNKKICWEEMFFGEITGSIHPAGTMKNSRKPGTKQPSWYCMTRMTTERILDTFRSRQTQIQQLCDIHSNMTANDGETAERLAKYLQSMYTCDEGMEQNAQ